MVHLELLVTEARWEHLADLAVRAHLGHQVLLVCLDNPVYQESRARVAYRVNQEHQACQEDRDYQDVMDCLEFLGQMETLVPQVLLVQSESKAIEDPVAYPASQEDEVPSEMKEKRVAEETVVATEVMEKMDEKAILELGDLLG